jgi:hypothetical protein
MHAGTTKADIFEESKTELILFPASPNTEVSHGVLPDPFKISNLHYIHFTHEFCYMGSIITTDLSDGRDIAGRRASPVTKPLTYVPPPVYLNPRRPSWWSTVHYAPHDLCRAPQL